MASLSADADVVARNLAAVQARVEQACARADRDPANVTICVATKYVDADGLQALRDAGVKVAGENRLQNLIEKQAAFGDAFDWHFIGRVQSRKVPDIAKRVSTIHSLASKSARDRLIKAEKPLPKVFVEVNIGGEESKEGIAPDALDDFLSGCPFPVSGLMTMPPLAESPEHARPHFKRLAELAAERGLTELSMGTTQDFEIAVEEGATIIRVGSALFEA
jgi:pyridoxal phosphate enzyme (YggS family)